MPLVVLVSLSAAAALVGAAPADAKEGVKATLTSRIPLDAPAATQLKVAWRLFSVGEARQRQPFGANGVFVRLLSASGAKAREGFAPVGTYATGEYEATVVVPEGGIRDVEIGLRGWTSGPTGTRRSDLLFPITNDPVPRPAPIAPLASAGRGSVAPDGRSLSWLFVLGVGAFSTLLVLTAALVVHKRRNRSSAPAPDRGPEPARISRLFS